MARIKGFFGVNFIGENFIVNKYIIIKANTIIEAIEAAKAWYRDANQNFNYCMIEAKYIEILY